MSSGGIDLEIRPDPKITISGAKLQELQTSRDGPIYRYAIRAASFVQIAARGQVGVYSGRLRRDIRTIPTYDARGFAVYVGSSLPYARAHHEGTAAHTIEPKKASVLRFEVAGNVIFVARVEHPGTRPNRYLTDNLGRALFA